ncbi:MAG: hypothetical protein N3D11_02035 [Candidatus Sumerlaeia bacterium]|nr:hypothetical protein [Candidatus Sumerlaeia bacterium]
MPAVLTHFLENGFAPGTQFSDLPATPSLKTQIVVDAVVECARQQVLSVAPTLGRLAFGLPSDGVRRIVQWDISQQRPSERLRFETDTMKTLRLNAVVALGLIGAPQSVYELAAVFEREKDGDLKIAAALALATLGSRAGLSYLVDETGRANRTSSVAAGEALAWITGLDYGPDADFPVARREESAAKWKAWWRREGRTFQPDRAQILARRLTPPIRPVPRPPRTVRELLDCVAYPNDPRWSVDFYTAHTQLLQMGAGALEELETVVKDKNENLRIRREAVLVLTQIITAANRRPPAAQVQRAYRAVWWLRFDRNPEIREIARQCLPRLKQARETSG